MPIDVLIRPARPEDTGWLASLEQTVFEDPWNQSNLTQCLQNPRWVLLIAENLQQPVLNQAPQVASVGYLIGSVVGEEAELARMATLPQWRGRQVGRHLLRHFLDLMPVRGIKWVHLEVRPKNTAARALYEKAGFRETGHRPHYYPNGDDALLLRWEAPEGAGRMLVLGIETSCDETSVALVSGCDGALEVQCSLIASQLDAHRVFGGVVPEIASRKHLEMINPLLQELQTSTGIAWSELDLCAVTHGPGLMGALLVGVAAAKTLSLVWDIPCQPVNHLEGHIVSNFLEHPDLPLPMLCLVVSGGHTELLLMPEPGNYLRLGTTRDDAVGEAFDKVARVLGLPLPGGPNLERLAREGDAAAFPLTVTNLEPSFDFSYSGLKTAAAQLAARHPARLADIAAAFQRSAVAQLEGTVRRALRQADLPVRPRSLALAGGVAANTMLRTAMQQVADDAGLEFSAPAPIFCTDNAAMIAAAGYYRWQRRPVNSRGPGELDFDVHSVLPLCGSTTVSVKL